MLAADTFNEPPKLINASARPVNIALIAIPTRISFSGLNPDFHDRANTRKQANAPPMNANKGVMKNSAGKNDTISSWTNAAPDEIPMIPASASGLRMTDCSSTPDTDSAAPANNATIIRGKRRSRMASLDHKDLLLFKPKEFAKKLAIVYQQNDVPKDLTIEKLVGFGRLPHRTMLKRDQEADDEAIEWALTVTNLFDQRDKDLEALSGGERQRVWIAMALAQRSEILCLDEPTTYLDIYYQIELLELVKSLNEQYGLTIVMVLHDINQAIRYSDRIILMKSGQIVAEGPPREVITKEVIKEVYGVHAVFKEDEELGLYMMPLGV